MNYENIRLDIEDGVAVITFDRPEQMNVFSGQMIDELGDAYQRCDADDAVRVVVVTGSGKAFCAGMDMNALDNLSQGGGAFEPAVPFGRDEGTYAVAVSDLDGDGAPDLLVANVGGRNAVFLNDGTGRSWRERPVGEEAESTYGLDVADLDGDGFPEIGFANSGAFNRIFVNRGGP